MTHQELSMKTRFDMNGFDCFLTSSLETCLLVYLCLFVLSGFMWLVQPGEYQTRWIAYLLDKAFQQYSSPSI